MGGYKTWRNFRENLYGEVRKLVASRSEKARTADPAQRSRGKERVKARLRSEKAAPDEMREARRGLREGAGGGNRTLLAPSFV
jgi:hypothetical protein